VLEVRFASKNQISLKKLQNEKTSKMQFLLEKVILFLIFPVFFLFKKAL